jgi:hypothetical protein
MNQSKATRTADFNLEQIRGRESLDAMLKQMGEQINARIKELFAELRPGQVISSITLRWDNIPERLTNPDKTYGYWAVFATRNDAKP